MELISRREALSLGLKRFYTGKRCKYDHDSERFVSSGACIACVNPKIATADLPPALEKFKLPNGRVVSIISKEDAYARNWRVYFTGLPCSEGHLAERSVNDDRCLACMHPTKYGPDAQGWLPFSPKPPLRVPPRTPLHVWPKLVEKLQALIPKLLQEIGAEGSVALPREPQETVIFGAVHRHHYQMWQGLKVWWPFPVGIRETITGLPPALQDATLPWVEKDGKWYAIAPTGSLLMIEPRQHEVFNPGPGFGDASDDGDEPSGPSEPVKATDEPPEDYAAVRELQKRIMEG